jgi:hypothetical protein
MPTNLYIQWRIGGAPIMSGSTGDSSNLSISGFTAEQCGLVLGVDFLVYTTDPTGPTPTLPIDNSQTVVLSNNLPTISASVNEDSYGRTPIRPTFTWAYSDVDNDTQFQYQVKIGTSAGASDLHDSGVVYSTASSYTVPDLSAAIPAATLFYWTVEVSDGQKINPALPAPTPRIVVAATGTAVANTKPVISNVLLDGAPGGTVGSLTPLISWTYSDVDGQPQSSFRAVVARDAGLTDILWDSGTILGTATTVRYNFQHAAANNMEHHKALYAAVLASDGIENSTTTFVPFIVAGSPQITTLAVDGRVNPLNVAEQQPVFNWKYTDLDEDPLVSYEIRVGTSDVDLGTDSFIGDVWAPGIITSPNAYSTQLDFDGTAFGGEMSCVFPHSLQPNTRYYFQVMIFDQFGGVSTWSTGYFQLNAPPRAVNLYIVPPQPWNSDSLDCVYTFVDDIGDRESNFTQIHWFQQLAGGTYAEVVSLINQRSVPSDLTVPGDLWKFTVRPHDGYEYSTVAYESAPVLIRNRPPVATALAITPGSPKTNDNLTAIFAVSDPDGDPVVVTINWYRNGEEQPDLKNATVIPASVTSLDDVWYFTILPTDGYDNGPLAISSPVTIANTAPQITSMMIDGQTFPQAVNDPNPTISWTYDDPDMQPQAKYQFILGTKPAKTKKILTDIARAMRAPSDSLAGAAISCGGQNGVISVAKGNGELVAGNDIFDSGIVDSPDNSFQYLTEDSNKDVVLPAVNFQNLTDYMLMPDLQTLSLQLLKASGVAAATFTGTTSLYDVELAYVKETGMSSTYKLTVDGIDIDQFSSSPGTGLDIRTFNSVKLDHNSVISIKGASVTAGAKAGFHQVKCVAKSQVEVNAADFAALSGYLKDGTGGIKLAGLAGTATTPFTLPSGTYDVELVYVTESAGAPIVTVNVNNTPIISLSYQVGPQTRSVFQKGVTISKGDTIKIMGTRSGSALARVKRIIYRPVETTKVGAKLKNGLVYYGSVRVYDGRDWSDWYTTVWRMSGAAWAAVSNRTGWTIETTMTILPGLALQQNALAAMGQP